MAQLQLSFLSGPSRKAKSLFYSCPGRPPSPQFVLAILTKPSFSQEKMHNGLNYVQMTLTPGESLLGSPQRGLLNFQWQCLKITQSRHKSDCQMIRALRSRSCVPPRIQQHPGLFRLQNSALFLTFTCSVSLLPATYRNRHFYPVKSHACPC